MTEINMISEIIAECEAQIGQTLSSYQREKISGYYDLLLAGNRTIGGLISKQRERDVLHYGILEAYGLVQSIKHYPGRMIDIGSGSGLPGMLAGIFLPDNPMVLNDIITRRCDFMAGVINELNLKNLSVVNCKAEKLQKLSKSNYHGYDVVFTSGVGHYDLLLKHYYRLVKSDGLIVLLTGAQATSDLTFPGSRTIINPGLPHRNLILIPGTPPVE